MYSTNTEPCLGVVVLSTNMESCYKSPNVHSFQQRVQYLYIYVYGFVRRKIHKNVFLYDLRRSCTYVLADAHTHHTHTHPTYIHKYVGPTYTYIINHLKLSGAVIDFFSTSVCLSVCLWIDPVANTAELHYITTHIYSCI